MRLPTWTPGGGSLESAAADMAKERYVLTLYVTGAMAGSLRAIDNIKAICEQYLKGRHKKLPVPLRLLVGDLSRTDQVLQGLGLVARTS